MKVFADKYMEIVRQTGSTEGIIPVDAFGGFVAVDKYDRSNLSRTQESIQWKTQLTGPLGYGPIKGEVK